MASTMPIQAPGRGASSRVRVQRGPRQSRVVAEARGGNRRRQGFYRDLVWNLRNGVLAVTRDGRIAVMNEVAYRVLGSAATQRHRDAHSSRCSRTRPDVSRSSSGAFERRTCPTAPRCA